MSGLNALTLLNLREQSTYQRTEIDSLKARVRLLETQELPFISLDGPVTNAQLATMPALTFKGNNFGTTAPADDLTASEAATMLMTVGTWSLSTINNTQINTGIVRRNGAADLRLQPFTNPGKGILIQDSTGYVGLNETSPDGQLHVRTPSTVPALTLETEGASDSLLMDFKQAGTLAARLNYLDSGDLLRLDNNYGPIQLAPGSGGTPETMLQLRTVDAIIGSTTSLANGRLEIAQTNNNPVIVTRVASNNTSNAIESYFDGSLAMEARLRSNVRDIYLRDYDNGTGPGTRFVAGRNNNGSTPAAGHILLYDLGGTSFFLWLDDSGTLRRHTAQPSNANDTAGIVIGTQTSHYLEKRILGPAVSPAEALGNIINASELVQEFEYLSGAFGFERFSGLVLRGSVLHRYGMDADEWHPAGRSLNTVNLHGDTVLAITELARRLALVEANLGLQ